MAGTAADLLGIQDGVKVEVNVKFDFTSLFYIFLVLVSAGIVVVGVQSVFKSVFK